MSDTTTIEVYNVTWRRLNARKQPGESFDDVIRRLLAADGSEEIEEMSARS